MSQHWGLTKTQPIGRGRGFKGWGKARTAKGRKKEEEYDNVQVAEEEMEMVEAEDLEEERAYM